MHIIIAHFGTHYVGNPGGVEKVVCLFSNEMIRRGHEVTILYRDYCEGNPYFPLDSQVIQHNILFQDGKKIISEKTSRKASCLTGSCPGVFKIRRTGTECAVQRATVRNADSEVP